MKSKNPFYKRIIKVIFSLLFLFVLLFIFRLIYGFYVIEPQTTTFYSGGGIDVEVRKNYASTKYKSQTASTKESSGRIDQKYEKIAQVNTRTDAFEADEKQTRASVGKYNAIIQYEQKFGNKGYRILNLVVGVPPDNFDSLFHALINIGKVEFKQITKNDKTNEYKELNAKKKSLEKISASLIELKNKGGRIEEYMMLEDRILEIQNQLQGLGVSLGDFDEENEFCTVQLSLIEGEITKISLIHRIKVALEWTITFYLQLVIILFIITLLAYLILLSIEKLKLLERIIKQ